MDSTYVKQVFDILAKPFHPDDVEWRPQKFVKNGSCQVLAYITARGVMNRLDEAVGPANWDMHLQPIDMGVSAKLDKQGNHTDYKGFVCTLTLRIEDEEGNVKVVTRQDVANLTDFEAIKGGASGAIKRAAVQFGIGRYLYGLGQTWVQTDDKGKFKTPKLPVWALPDGYEYPETFAKTENTMEPTQEYDNAEPNEFEQIINNLDRDVDENPLITFGKHNGKHFSEIPIDYIEWLARNAQKPDMKEAASKWVATHGAGTENAPW